MTKMLGKADIADSPNLARAQRGAGSNTNTSGEDTRLRVLFINDTSRNGGPGRTLLDILKFLDPASVRRDVMIPREGIVGQRIRDSSAAETLIVEPDFIEHIFEPFSRAVEREDLAAPLALKLFRAAGNVGRALRGLRRLTNHVRRERYDVIFCNGTTANFVGGALAAWTKTPVVWHVLYTSVPAIQRPLHARLAANRNVRLIACVSRPATHQFSHCAEKVRLIPDAIDLDEFDRGSTTPILRRELGFGERTTVFGSFGRILPRKGYVELVHAARIVFERMDSEERSRCRFVVVGDTPQDMKPDHLEECRVLVRQLGLSDAVHFIGFRPDIRPYALDFDVALVPSVYQDPLPRAVLESMAMGKPVIAFDVGGIGEMITDGVEGRLAKGDPPDVNALAEACLSYLRDPETRILCGAAARARVERDFDARRHAQRIQNELLRIARRSV